MPSVYDIHDLLGGVQYKEEKKISAEVLVYRKG